MESTGKYWVPVVNLLEDDINVVIANPKWVKAVKGNNPNPKRAVTKEIFQTSLTWNTFPGNSSLIFSCIAYAINPLLASFPFTYISFRVPLP